MADYSSDPGALACVERMRELSPQADPLAVMPDVHPERIPEHIAIIMDGNGRWAEERGFPRVFGHRNGAKSVRDVLEEALRLGVRQLTLYSFSLENWKRPADEVGELMRLCCEYTDGNRERLLSDGVRFRVIGRREGLPAEVIESVERLEEATRDCEAATLCLALNYGGRAEIADAARSIAESVRAGELEPGDVDEDEFERRLYTAGMPDPDLLVRTAGEMRVSNYLLWQISYSEIYVTDLCWPDFGPEQLREAVRAFAARTRRFGGLVSDAGRGE